MSPLILYHTFSVHYRRYLLLIMIIVTAGCTLGVSDSSATLEPPAAYRFPVESIHSKTECSDFPKPHSGSLAFPSKYEGSGKSRDKLNTDRKSVV